jgi:hypothetical protein
MLYSSGPKISLILTTKKIRINNQKASSLGIMIIGSVLNDRKPQFYYPGMSTRIILGIYSLTYFDEHVANTNTIQC